MFLIASNPQPVKLLMKKLITALTVILTGILSNTYTYGQQTAIKGTVTDTISKQNLHNAVVTLLRAKDSVLTRYTRADAKGNFEMKNLAAGRYIIMISYPGYVEMLDTVTLQKDPPRNFGTVALNTRAHLLQEVIVRQHIAPIRIKGDTTEYLADSFKVKAGATVEDLLKVMPGFTVNSKGEIVTQGQKVQKVLVDGDEFFGDDPTMATQNLNARDVAKVQVFDKKSDQSALTGIDDGEKKKTVNLILKDDAKKGHFGKAEAGTDFNKYYKAKATVNKFTSTLKAGAYLTADRTGRNGMSWEEMQDFGNVNTVVEGGNVMMWSEGDEFNNYNTQGIPENLQAAFMLNKKFGKLKSSTVSNYSYNHQNLAGESYTGTKYILPDTVYYNNLSALNRSTRLKHTANTKNEFKLDSATTLTVNARGSSGRSNQYTSGNSEYLTSSKVPVNMGTHTNYSSGDNSSARADIFLNRKLNKSGTRSLTLNVGFTDNHSNSDGYQYNRTDFYKYGTPDSTQLIDQRKTNRNTASSAQALASYTEPLSKRLALNLNYTFNSANSEQDIRSYEKKGGQYDSLNMLYSNHFRFINTSHRAGFGFTYTNPKITARIGVALQYLSLKQTNLYKDSSYARNFTNFFPNANFRWKFSQTGNFNINYSGSTIQPSLGQLQPIINNNDPLNLVIGNPDLKPSFNHSIYFNAGHFKVLSNRNIWSYGGFNFTENAFSSKSVVDARGKRTTQTVNVNGNYNFYLGLYYSKQIKFLKLELGFEPRANGNRNVNFVNGIESVTKSYDLSPGVRIGKSIEKKMNVNLRYAPAFSHSESSINRGAVTEYWTQTVGLYFDYKLMKDLSINSDLEANYRQKLSPADRNNNAVIWNASLEKSIWKKKDLTAIISVNDILNQQIGFNRNITSNYITENTYTTVQRYMLFSLRWKFNKNKKVSDNE